MLDYDKMDILIMDKTYIMFNEELMKVTLCIDDGNFANDTITYFPRDIESFPLGENLFSFLNINTNDIKHIQEIVTSTPRWNERHEQDDIEAFFSKLDCVYLYLLFYSNHRDDIGNQYGSRLDRLVKEFDFALNFCCNDDFIPQFKHLSSMERYYLYGRMYIDNYHTIDRCYQQNRFLFMETPQENLLDIFPRMGKTTDKHGYIINEFEPVTELPQFSSKLLEHLQDIKVTPTFRYEYTAIERYLMEELYLLIKLNVRIKKCANCGKYFILKGDYTTDCCDRIPKGEKYPCKKLMARKKRKKKLKENPIISEYERAYKRNYARLSNHKLTNEEFRLWVEEATQERDKISAQYKSTLSEELLLNFKNYLGNK